MVEKEKKEKEKEKKEKEEKERKGKEAKDKKEREAKEKKEKQKTGKDKEQKLTKEKSTVEKGSDRYEIEVKTADEMGGGTDSNIKLTLIGSEKTIDIDLDKEICISKNKNIFETGNLDKFELVAEPIGRLKKISLSHDGKGIGSDWKVDSVKIVINKDVYM